MHILMRKMITYVVLICRHYPEKMEIFHDLSQLLNLEDNKKYARELLDHVS